MNRQRLLKILFWLVALALLITVLLSVPLADTLDALRLLTWQRVLLLIAINLVVLALFNARWWAILRGYGYKLPFRALFGYRLATFGVSYFTPGPQFGGEPLQVLLVEKEQQTPRATAVAALTLDKSIELLVNFLFLLTGVILIMQQQLLDGAVAVAAILVIVLILLVPGGYLVAIANGRSPFNWTAGRLGAASIWHNRPAWQERFERGGATVRESESEMSSLLHRSPGTLIFAVLVSIAAWALMITEFWLMVSFLGAPLSPIQLIMAMTAARVAILLFLPAGLGALEVSQVVAFGAIGLNPALGISVSLLIRARDVFIGGAGLWWGSRKLSANYLTNESQPDSET